MMNNVDQKYKKWGWGAIIGLVGVILVSGIVMAIGLSSNPKPEEDGGEPEQQSPVIGEIASGEESQNAGGEIIIPAEGVPEQQEAQSGEGESQETQLVVPSQPAVSQPQSGGQNAVAGNDAGLPQSGADNVLGVSMLLAVLACAGAYGLEFAKRK